MKRAEIFSIGDELLRGLVQDSNSFWMLQRLTARGAHVERVTMLPDDPTIAGEEIRGALARGVDLVTTHGGLGPTDDDRTREALAVGLGMPCEPHAEASAIIQRRYAELARAGVVQTAEINAARERMGNLPRGAIALDNHVGAAPGIVVRAGPTTVVALPGVPPELHWIFEGPLSPILDQVLGPGGFAEWTAVASTNDESSIAEALAAVQARHPDVYVKSRAKAFGESEAVRVTLSASGETNDAARALVSAAQRELARALGEAGIRLHES